MAALVEWRWQGWSGRGGVVVVMVAAERQRRSSNGNGGVEAVMAAEWRQWWSGGGVEVAEDFRLLHVTMFPLLGGIEFPVFSLFFLGTLIPA